MKDRHQMLYLLTRTGVTLGLMLATVNWARDAGWGSLAFTLAPVLLAGALLGALLVVARPAGFWRWTFWRYSALSGALGMVIPNWLVFLTMAREGVISAAVFYLLSPLFTQALTWLMGYERLAPWRLAGLVVGAVGAAVLVAPGVGQAEAGTVPFVGLLIPLSLALGNIYRKRRMPARMDALTLATGMLLASGALFVPLLLVAAWWDWPGTAVGGGAPLVIQVGIMAFGFVSYYQFLRKVDPVYFSQLGYLVTVTGALAGVVLFGESPGWHHGVSLVLVVAGIWMVSRQTGKAHDQPR